MKTYKILQDFCARNSNGKEVVLKKNSTHALPERIIKGLSDMHEKDNHVEEIQQGG